MDSFSGIAPQGRVREFLPHVGVRTHRFSKIDTEAKIVFQVGKRNFINRRLGNFGQKLCHLVKQSLRLKRFHDPVINTGSTGTGFIKRLKGAGKQQYRHVPQGGILFHRSTQFIAIFPGHHNISHNQVRPFRTDSCQSGIAISDDCKTAIFICEDDSHHLLDGNTIIGQQQLLAHSSLPVTYRMRNSPCQQSTSGHRFGFAQPHRIRSKKEQPAWHITPSTPYATIVTITVRDKSISDYCARPPANYNIKRLKTSIATIYCQAF